MAEKDERTVLRRYFDARMRVENPPMDSENPHFGNRFASLTATLKAINDAAKPEGIIYCIGIDGTNLKSYVTDGAERVELSTFPLMQMGNPQQVGSQLTYSKRQLAQLDWGIVGEVDDDAEGASKAKPKGEFDARCTTCGCTYHFKGQGQFTQWLASSKGQHPQGGNQGAGNCPNPNWQVVNG